jgi:hypothetical protein
MACKRSGVRSPLAPPYISHSRNPLRVVFLCVPLYPLNYISHRIGLMWSSALLTKLMNEGVQSKLTLISASAGCGKTTLVSEWLASCSQPVGQYRVARGQGSRTVCPSCSIASVGLNLSCWRDFFLYGPFFMDSRSVINV